MSNEVGDRHYFFCNMIIKRLLLSIIVCCSSIGAICAQNQADTIKNLFFEVSPILPTNGGDAAFDLRIGGYHPLDRYLSVGASVGLLEPFKFNIAPSVPILFRLHAENSLGMISPFFNFDAGYSLNLEEIKYGSVVINPSLGIRYEDYTFAIGYYGNIATYSIPKGAKSLISSINLTFGYRFGIQNNSHNKIGELFRNLRFLIDFGMTMPFASNANSDFQSSAIGLTANLAIMKQLSDNLYIGLASGYTMFSESIDFQDYTDNSLDGDAYIPYAIRARYEFSNFKLANKVYPFVQMDLGGATYIPYDNERCSSPFFYYAPTVGLSMDIYRGKHSLDLGVTFAPVKFTDFNADEASLIKNSLRLALGLKF